MASIENEVFTLLATRGNHEKYREYVPQDVLSMVGLQFIKEMDEYWATHPAEQLIDWDTFKAWLAHVGAPSDPNLKAMQQVAEVNKEVEVSTLVAKEILNRIVERDIGEQIQEAVEEAATKGAAIDHAHIYDLLEHLNSFQSKSDLDTDDTAVSTDIEDVLKNSHVTDDGLPLPLDVLRRAVGPLRPGDTVYVPARPETGKTTFLIHSATHMMEHTEDTSAILFSNEEDGNRLMMRIYQSALNWTAKEIMSSPADAKAAYEKKFGSLDRIRVYHSSVLQRKDVERIIEKLDPDVVMFNMLNKIKGFNKKNTSDVDVLTHQAVWMREIANGYGVAAMTAWQAGGTAHGKAWLEQDDMYASKTGVPAEADLILGIGKVIDDTGTSGLADNARFLHLSKNKLIGDSKTEEKLRHGYFDSVFIDEGHGRFTEL